MTHPFLDSVLPVTFKNETIVSIPMLDYIKGNSLTESLSYQDHGFLDQDSRFDTGSVFTGS